MESNIEQGVEMLEEFDHAGLHCYVFRVNDHYCGYVEVPRGHEFDRVDYDDLGYIDVHGGITFGQESDGVWTFGWDAAHGGDVCDLPQRYNKIASPNRSLDWAIEETKKLANQLNNLPVNDNDKVFNVLWEDNVVGTMVACGVRDAILKLELRLHGNDTSTTENEIRVHLPYGVFVDYRIEEVD